MPSKKPCPVCGRELGPSAFRRGETTCRKCLRSQATQKVASVSREELLLAQKLREMTVYRFQPQDQQKDFINVAQHPEKGTWLYLLKGGNQVGKTLCACVIAARYAMDYPGRNVALVSTTLDELSNTIWNYFFEDYQFQVDGEYAEALIPSWQVKSIGYIQRSRNLWKHVELINGSKIRVYSYDSDPKVFRGWQADLILCDEFWPATRDGLLAQLRARVQTRGGRVIIAATSEDNIAEECDDLEERITNGELKGAKLFRWSYDRVEHKSTDEIAAYIASLPEEERAARIYGLGYSRYGPVYPYWKECVITQDDLVQHGVINKHGRLHRHIMPEIGIDPGGSSLFSIVLIGTDVTNGAKYVLDEFAQKQQTVKTIVPHLIRMMQKWGIPREEGLWRGVIDYGRDRTPLGSTKAAFYEEFSKHGVVFRLGGHGLINAHKADRDNTVRLLRDMMGGPNRTGQLFVLEDCQGVRKELRSYHYRPNGELPKSGQGYPHDRLDALRYAATTPGGPPIDPDLRVERKTRFDLMREKLHKEWNDDEPLELLF